MKRLTLLLFFIYTFLFINAQPGGGGGLTIGNLYDKKFKQIELNEPDLIIRCFVLIGNNVQEELYDFYPLKLQPSKWNYYFDREQSFADQRLLVEYKSDIMIVDLINIMQENGMGNSDYMDSLVFSNTHLTVNTNPNNQERNNDWQKNSALLNNGITPYTTAALKESNWISYQKNISVYFLNEENLSAHFILKRGVNSYRREMYDNAIVDINFSITKGLNSFDTEEALATLSLCYFKKENYLNAIEYLNSIIESRNVKDNYRLMHYYKLRIDAYTELKEYNFALNDFDFIISNTEEHQFTFIAEKAEYTKKYLNDCESGLKEFEKIISEIPHDHLRDRPGGLSEYNDTYFAMGSLEFSCFKYNAAFINWLKAMEYGYAQTSDDQTVVFFDSLIKLFPYEPKLYLSKAIALYKRSPYLGWGELTKEVLKESVDDIDKAEKFGMNDFRINLYRAKSLHLLKMNDDALIEINIAIKKNKNDPRAYAVRYQILSDLGKTTWGKDHPDLVKYRELSREWKFSDN